MLPRAQGGVVDAHLRVYGLANVRVADASVPPLALSTHLMSSTYGVAEQASRIIREYYAGFREGEGSATMNMTRTATAVGSAATETTATQGVMASGIAASSRNANVGSRGGVVPVLVWMVSVGMLMLGYLTI